MANTTVGTVSYDVRLNLGQLKKDTSQAEKIVDDSYKKIANSSKQSRGGAQSNQITKDVQAQVNATKKAAQESYNAISQYTPQIQKQFLTVERANNAVTNATTRSQNAITKYGQSSTQATSASNSLSTAVKNQAGQQAKLNTMVDGTYQANNKFSSGMNETVGTLATVAAGIVTLTAVTQLLKSSVASATEYQSAIAGISRVSERFGYDAQFATAEAQKLASDGLITVSTAASGLQKLLTAGVGLPEAIKLMQGYKDQAAFGKSSTIDLDTAVGNLAESFYTENSAIGNLSGQTENWNQILEYGASVLGKNVSQLTDKERIQAKLIGQMRLNNAVEGDAGLLAQTTAGKQAQLDATLKNMQITIGRVTQSLTGGLIGALGGTGVEGEKTAISIGAGVTAFVAVLTIAPLVIRGVKAITTAIKGTGIASAFASGGITVLVGALAAVAASVAMDKLIGNLDTADDLAVQFGSGVKQASSGLTSAAKGAGDLAKKLADVNAQMEKVREDYRYSLAELVRDKNANISSLLETLTGEKRAYDNALSDRTASFDKNEDEQLQTHLQKTRALQKQIDFLTKYNNSANQQQLSELKFSLARENAEYQKSTQLRQNEFSTQTESATEEYEKRRAENQKKLDAEIALLEKHREEVLSIRDVMLKDEIEKLKAGRDEQLKSLAEQKREIISNGAAISQVAKTTSESWDGVIAKFSGLVAQSSTFAGNLLQAANNASTLQNTVSSDKFQNAAKNLQSVGTAQLLSSGTQKSLTVTGSGSNQVIKVGYADGGFTGQGNKNDVAGLVHKGEYVVPKSQVNQSTGTPKAGTGGTVVNVTINPSGIMASSKADLRMIASQMAELINEKVMAHTGKVAIQGL